MKRVIFILSLFFIANYFSSCKKDWTCECSNVSGADSMSFTLSGLRKADAVTVCNDYGSFIGQCAIK